MERILEPELMGDDPQAQAYAQADFEEPHSYFVKLFQETFAGKDIEGYVLDLGCGPGDISFRFARAYPRCVVHAVDGSEAMLAYGEKRLSQSQDVQGRIEFCCGLLPHAEMPRGKYDVIISNSLLHHLENPHVLWDSIRQYALPGTPVFVMDLRRPESIDQARKFTDMYAGNEPDILQRDFYNSLCASFEPEEVRAQLDEAGFSNLSVKEISDRHLLVSGYA